jgi:hypothetical protein
MAGDIPPMHERSERKLLDAMTSSLAFVGRFR